MDFEVRRMLRQILLDLRLAGVTHLPRSIGGTHLALEGNGPWVKAPNASFTLADEGQRGSGAHVPPNTMTLASGPPQARTGQIRSHGKITAKEAEDLTKAAAGQGEVPPQEQPPLRNERLAGAASEFSPAVSFSMLTLPAWAQEEKIEVLSPEEKRERLQQLARRVAGCRRCPDLVRNRTQTVFADGNPDSPLVFVGEAPGADEDRQGVPFVGRAGQLLTDIITKGMGLRREEVYICNVIKCRPPENRTPTAAEVANCREYLDEQLALIRPQYICCLGSIAAQRILGTKQFVTKIRGKLFTLGRTTVVCTYHPAYLLRNPEAKRETWEDIKLLMKAMGLAPPPSRKAGN